MERTDCLEREPVFLAPVKELVTGPCIGQAGVPVPDGGREESDVGIGSPGGRLRRPTQAPRPKPNDG
jgi:hypothetical protein